ncbi:MAG TPA: LuxR C-terminal-related transcriptional regulator [Spirochaetota bacterium]|nr:LuxR C-terminal-related transcriptional regulator [Spirochaetota bacterium]HPI89611.1 LuxR C-terminal-related transcriptional regulator [Spirochaetota bacterium]HPR48070.1 LuxR C-terminal-related transcriptional regulator [Spirochaetota bacterium]
MNITVFVFSITALVCLESSITVYRLNRRSWTNRLYTAGTLAYTLLSLAYIQMLLAPDSAACWFWHRVFVVLLFTTFMITIHFILELTRYRNLSRNRFFLGLLYGSGIAIIIRITLFVPILTGFEMTPHGWSMVYDVDSLWTWIAFNYPSPGLLLGAVALIQWRRDASNNNIKKQADFILGAGMAAVLLVTVQNIFPFFLSQDDQTLIGDAYHQIVTIVFLVTIRYAVWKYKLMSMAPSGPADELFTGMSDAIFLTNCRGEIIFMNDRARRIVRHTGRESVNVSIFNLFRSRGSFRKDVEDIIADRIPAHPLTVTLKESHHIKAVELSLHGVRNETGACIGTLAIAREQAGVADIQKKHRLSRRELEVLLLLCDGLSAGEIAEECDITLQTAKSHIHNIYSKTGLKNRVELTNLLNRST